MSATVEWSGWIVPLILGVVSLAFLRRRRDHFSDFLEGARMGAESCIRIFPSLLALVGALNVFTASGLADAIARLLTPVLTPIGIPAEIITLILVRPMSGSGALAAYSNLIDRVGVDSFAGLCASVIMGSSDTLIYIAAVYFSAAGVRKTRYTIPLGLALSFLSVLFSCALCRILLE